MKGYKTMRMSLLFAAFAVVGALTVPARANVIYTFNPAVAIHRDPDHIGSVEGVSFRLTLKDQAISNGSFHFGGSGSGDNSYTLYGDVGNFVRLDVNEGYLTEGFPAWYDYVTPNHVYGTFAIDLIFGPQDNVADGRLTFGGLGAEFNLAVSNNFVSGTWGSDFYNCSGCEEYGALVIARVPEPGSAALLSVGLAGLLAARRRRASA